jgi:hypothetical protein
MPPTEIIFSIEESPEGGFQARALGFSIFTEADSLDELKTMIRDAVSCHFDPVEKPSVIRLHMVRDDVIPA